MKIANGCFHDTSLSFVQMEENSPLMKKKRINLTAKRSRTKTRKVSFHAQAGSEPPSISVLFPPMLLSLTSLVRSVQTKRPRWSMGEGEVNT